VDDRDQAADMIGPVCPGGEFVPPRGPLTSFRAKPVSLCVKLTAPQG
jgi:hypothetical protein